MIRKTIFLIILLAGISLPVFLHQSKDDSSQQSHTSTGNQNPNAHPFYLNVADNGLPVNHPHGQNGQQNLPDQPIVWPGPTQPPEQIYQPVSDFREIFRFDIYPNWVKHRWPRVSNTPGELGLQGMRVPLVTGPHPSDLSGSLTYYFDENQQVQRICFQGWTGQPTRLMSFVFSEFGFQRRPASGAGLFLKKKNWKTHSLLRVDEVPVVRQAEPHKQVFVYLELNHPRGSLPLSNLGKQALETQNN